MRCCLSTGAGTIRSGTLQFVSTSSRRPTVEQVRHHVQFLKGLAREEGTTIGLSAGYDSRLVLALALEANYPVEAHTWTSGAHRLERSIALDLAWDTGIRCRSVRVRLADTLPRPDLEANIVDSLGYWGGRCNESQGTFHDVHTAATRMAVLGQARLGLSGHGGELFRNREHLPPRPFPRDHWLRYFVFNPRGWQVITDPALRLTLEQHLLGKYARLLGNRLGKWMSRHDARRWYARVWLPFGGGPKLCAENQLSFALILFA